MFFFFGISPKTIRHGFVMHDCRVHGGSSWHELTTQRSYFTLFFVLRVFPVGGRHELLTCTTCGATWQLPPAEAMRLQAQARTDTGPTAGGIGGMRRGGSMFGGVMGDVMRQWAQQTNSPGPPPTGASNSTSASTAGERGPRSVRAERLDVPRDPKQKVQWRPNG